MQKPRPTAGFFILRRISCTFRGKLWQNPPIMTPGARLKAVLDILDKIDHSRIPMDGTVGDYMRFRRYIGSKDRAEIVERLYNMVRAKARLNWWMDHLSAPDTNRARVILWMMLGENVDGARLEKMFNGGKYDPEELDDAELKLIRAAAKNPGGHTMNHPDMPEAIRVECPPQHEDALRALWGADFAAEMEAMLTSAPLDLRVNLLATDRDAVRASLAKDGVEVDDAPLCPWTLRARSKAFLSKTKAFTKGHVEIQDEGSQLIAYLCDAKPGAQVLDYCAGAGGKTLALINAMQVERRPKGRIVAMDLEEARLERARPRFRRAHASDIIEIRPLSDERHRKWLRRQKETFDVVLTDVPCSGTGTWRRNPDTRWRAFGPSLDALVQTQAEILDKVAGAVKPGGRLVYATCSILPRENEDQIDAFLARHPDFEIWPIAEAVPDMGDKLAATPGGPFMRLSPRRHNTDGFFAAILRRKTT